MSKITLFLAQKRGEILAHTSISRSTLSAVILGKYELNARHIREIMILFPEFIKIFLSEGDDNGKMQEM